MTIGIEKNGLVFEGRKMLYIIEEIEKNLNR